VTLLFLLVMQHPMYSGFAKAEEITAMLTAMSERTWAKMGYFRRATHGTNRRDRCAHR
jgi:hypothetical protein